tara:strand:- start:2254 stop:2370 length:117 start_codon:yes stop_codon:yes gene_type:complete
MYFLIDEIADRGIPEKIEAPKPILADFIKKDLLESIII